MSAWGWIGLIAVGGLLLIPLAMIASMLSGLPGAIIDALRRSGKRQEATVPGLGVVETSDGRNWSCEIEGIDVGIRTDGSPPSPAVGRPIREVVERLPELVREARAWFGARPDLGVERPGALEIIGLEWRSADDFEVTLYDPTEDFDDWSYTLTFRKGVPTESSAAH